MALANSSSHGGSGGAVLRSGTAFPGSPSDGDLFYRTDRGILYEYVAAVSKWLSVDRKYVTFGNTSVLDGTTNTGHLGQIPIFEDVYVESWVVNTVVLTTNNGSNFYTFSLMAFATVLDSVNTSAGSAGTWESHNRPIGVVVAASVLEFQIGLTKTGTPGNRTSAIALVLRSVG